MKVKTIKQDNLEIDYVNFGKGEKSIVIIPGLFSSVIDIKKQKYLFKYYYKDLAKYYNVYIFGKNKNIHDNYSIENIAEDQLKALELLDIKKTHLIGISQGGMIAQTVAIKNTSIIDKLVICVSTSKTNNETKKVINNWIDLSIEKDLKNLVMDVTEKSLNKNKIKKLQKFYFLLEKLKDKLSYEKFIIHAKSCVNHNCEKLIEKIVCPTLIIGAKNDEVINYSDSIEMNKVIKDSRIKIYDNLGHDIYSNSSEINKDILQFLDEE